MIKFTFHIYYILVCLKNAKINITNNKNIKYKLWTIVSVGFVVIYVVYST